MLHEIKNAKKFDEGIRIRWFSDDFFDLVIWYDDDGNIISFQLTYDKYNDPHALTWKLGKGYIHETIDDGETPGRYKQSPILLPDGDFPGDAISEKFKQHTIKGEPELTEFISDIISSMNKDDGDTGNRQAYPVFVEMAFTQKEKKRLLHLAETIFTPRATGDITAVINEYELQQQIQFMTSRIKLSEKRFNILCILIIEAYQRGLLNAKEDVFILNKISDSSETYATKIDTMPEKTEQFIQQIKEIIHPLENLINKTNSENIKSKAPGLEPPKKIQLLSKKLRGKK